MGPHVSDKEALEIVRLAELGLIPISSDFALATMLGVNPGLIWSFANRTNRHYRSFLLPKGNGARRIFAPRVGLKVLQKWLSFHFQTHFVPPDHVFGFVPGRSHLQAAKIHTSAQWVYSIDIENFFPSTSSTLVVDALTGMGYSPNSGQLIAKLLCRNEKLTQGSPASPVVSNLVFADTDVALQEIASDFGVRLSRYADDIVFSGAREFPENLVGRVRALFDKLPWAIAVEKEKVSKLPSRLKVHGLLVHGESIRLTKGYRNRLRAYKHLFEIGKIRDEDRARILGHLLYEKHVEDEASD